MNRLRRDSLSAAVLNRMAASGVDNYHYSNGRLRIGARHYAVTGCACGEPECDGLRLRPVQTARRVADAPMGPDAYPAT